MPRGNVTFSVPGEASVPGCLWILSLVHFPLTRKSSQKRWSTVNTEVVSSCEARITTVFLSAFYIRWFRKTPLFQYRLIYLFIYFTDVSLFILVLITPTTGRKEGGFKDFIMRLYIWNLHLKSHELSNVFSRIINNKYYLEWQILFWRSSYCYWEDHIDSLSHQILGLHVLI